MTDKRIVLTGGGTAGHVIPNIALIPELVRHGFEIHYIGSKKGIEKELISKQENVIYHDIPTGKLRRYFSVKNFTDPFRILAGTAKAFSALKKIDPAVIFSKGGFVSVPVVMAARQLNIPVVLHESDLTPGLANKICIPLSNVVCAAQEKTLAYLPANKSIFTGNPIRAELLSGEANMGFAFCGFAYQRPTLLVMGGSLGSVAINECVREIIPKLVKRFNIVHICGAGHYDESLERIPGYVQFEFISDEMRHILALSDVVVSRAGATIISELLALKKPSVLIPLPRAQSRGDQIVNARHFAEQGYGKMLPQEEMSPDEMYIAIDDLYREKSRYIARMESAHAADSNKSVAEIILGQVTNAKTARNKDL